MKKLKHVSRSTLGLFYESVGFMLQSGVNVRDCAEMLKDDPSRAIKPELLDIVIDGCTDGQDLSSIVKDNPILGPHWRQIAVAEQTGRLPECISRISKQIRDTGDIQRKIKMAMIQPLAIFFLGLAICVYLLNTVVTQVGDMMLEFDAEMPGITMAMIAAQDHVLAFWPLDLAIIVGTVALTKFLIGGPLSMPFAQLVTMFKVTSGVSINSNYSLVYRLLHDMIENGSHMVEALRIAAASCTNKFIQHELYCAADDMESEGVSLQESLQATKTMPPQDKLLLKVGMESGRGNEILSQLTDHRTTVTSELVNGISELVSPLVSLATGLFLLVIMLGVTLPMYSLTSAI